MPVLRKRERAQVNIGYSPVAARGNPMIEVMGQTAGMLAQKAADYARAMTVEAEETAKALAKAAVFNTGANGLPELPDNLAAKMGNAARRTYDATMETRFLDHMTTSVKMRLAEIANAHISDPEGFVAEAEGAISDMSADVPDAYKGAFQEISTGQLVDQASGIGYRQGVLLEEDRRGQTATMIDNMKAGIIENVRIGDVDKATAGMQEAIATIEAQPMSIMSRGQKDAAISGLFYDLGVARLITENDLKNASPEELAAVHASLIAGDDPKLAAYFTRPGSKSPDPDQMMRAGQYVLQLMGAANDRMAAERKQDTDRIGIDWVMQGYGSGTKEEKDRLDLGISGSVKLRDENGRLRAVEPDDWTHSDEQTQSDMMQAVKEAGFAPTSLEMKFRQLSRSSDPEELWRGALLYRDLREQTTADGTKVDLTSIVDPRLVGIFDLAEIHHGGGEPSMDDIQQAVLDMTNIENNRWTPEDFANKLTLDGYGGLFSAVAPEDVPTTISDIVSTGVFEANGITPRAEEKKKAEDSLKLYLEMNYDVETATEKVRQQFQNMYVESPALGGMRSADAPELAFVSPPATFLEAIANAGEGAKGGILKGLEGIADLPGFMTGSNFSFGGDRALADPWELIADDQIKKMLVAQGYDYEDFRVGETQKGSEGRFLKPGVDYILKPAGPGKDGKPTYRVFMKQTTGASFALAGRLDMADEFRKMTELSEALKLEKLRLSRGDRQANASGHYWLYDLFPDMDPLQNE